MLPRIVRRLLWLWAGVGVFTVVIFVLVLVAQPRLPPIAPGTQAVVTLTSPSGIAETVVVDLANDPDEWRRGLQNRPVVERPMVFVFPSDEPRSFWMKDTLVPLDIFFFRSDGSWVSSHRMIPCLADPCPSTLSGGPARYALEVPVGETGPAVGTGWRLTVEPRAHEPETSAL